MKPQDLVRVIKPDEIGNLEHGKILTITLRVPTACNLNCGYCYGKVPSNEKPVSFEELNDFLSQAQKLGARTVSIVGEGEPLLYKNFRELVQYINSLEMIPTIFSNCVYMTKKLADFLYKNNAVLIGKQNSLNQQIQDKITGVKGSFVRMQRGLKLLIERGFNSGSPSRLGIHTVVLKDNIDEIPHMWIDWRGNNILPQVQVMVPPSRFHSKNQFEFYKKHPPSPHEIRNLFETLSCIDKKHFGYDWNPIKAYPIAPSGCMAHYASLGITSTGKVHVCNYLEDDIGDLRKQSLKEIINSKKAQTIRNKKFAEYPNKCYGCRVIAYNIYRDRFARDPVYDSFLI